MIDRTIIRHACALAVAFCGIGAANASTTAGPGVKASAKEKLAVVAVVPASTGSVTVAPPPRTDNFAKWRAAEPSTPNYYGLPTSDAQRKFR